MHVLSAFGTQGPAEEARGHNDGVEGGEGTQFGGIWAVNEGVKVKVRCICREVLKSLCAG